MLRSSSLLLLVCGLQLAAAVVKPQECFLQPSPGILQVAWPCASTTQCYLKHLGEPKTLGEWWMAYASAVTEYCAALNASGTSCSQEPLCRNTYKLPKGLRVGQLISSDDADEYEKLMGERPLLECWPDWEAILRHPCIGCQDYQLFRCAGATEQAECEALSEYCQYWPNTGASSLQYCWPKWLLHDMFVNPAKFEQYTHHYYYNDQPETQEYDISLNPGMRVWSVVSPGLGLCGHQHLMVAFRNQLLESTVKVSWSVPCLRVYETHPYGNAFEAWPYLTLSSWSDDLSLSDSLFLYSLLHVHKQLSMPWTGLLSLLEQGSSWKHRLLDGNISCANVTNIHAASCNMEASANTVMHILHGYCSVAFNSSCNGSDFKRTTFACDTAHGGAQLALGVIWVVFGIVMLLVIILVEFAWSIAGTLRRVLADTELARWNCISRSRISYWLQRLPVCYHPAVMSEGHTGSAAARAASWRRVLSIINNYILAGAYVADVILDIWTIATLFTYNGEGQYAMLDEGTRFIYGTLLCCVFATQYLLGAALAIPAVLATHGLLDYTWFKMTPALRVVLLLPPTWVLLLSLFFILLAVFFISVGLLGIWYLMVADLNMLLTLVGVPPHWLLGNKLNMEAVMILRFLCEGIAEALPSALISTAIIYSQLIRGQPMGWRFAVFWLSLISSLVRVGRELYKLLRLTYDLHACCFVTAIVDVCYHLQPHTAHSLPVATAESGPHTSFGRQSGSLSETRCTETTATPAVQNCTVSVQPGLGPSACPKDSGLDVLASTSHQMLPHPTSVTVNGVSRHSSRGCCWSGASDQVHPRALVVYVWVWLALFLPGIAVVCVYVICPGSFGDATSANSCGTNALISVWSSLKSNVASPKDALACLTQKPA